MKNSPQIAWLVLGAMALVCQSSEAKKLKISWMALFNAVKYELEIRRNKKVVFKKVLPRNVRKWEGNFPPGLYAYRLRAIDRVNRPGVWSDFHALVAAAPVPTLLTPKNEFEQKEFKDEFLIELKWEPSKGASHYWVQVRKDGELFLERKTQTANLLLPKLGPGIYFWKVKALLYGEGELPKPLETNEVSSEYSSESNFTLETKQLAAPELNFPVLKTIEPDEQNVTLSWDPVDQAIGYEVRILQRRTDRRPASFNQPVVRKEKTKETTMKLEILDETQYRWSVRAVFDYEADSPKFRSPASATVFRVQRDSYGLRPFFLSLDGDLDAFEYAVRGPTTASGNSTAVSSEGGVSVRYWFWSRRFGVQANLRAAGYIFGPTYIFPSYHIGLRYRLVWGSFRAPWTLSFFGLGESRTFFLNQERNQGVTVDSFATLGPLVGLELNKAISPFFKIGIIGDYYYPLSLSGAPTGAVLTHEKASENVRGGIQGWLRFMPKFSLRAGMFIQLRSSSFQLPGQSSSEIMTLRRLVASGSIVYEWGG